MLCDRSCGAVTEARDALILGPLAVGKGLTALLRNWDRRLILGAPMTYPISFPPELRGSFSVSSERRCRGIYTLPRRRVVVVIVVAIVLATGSIAPRLDRASQRQDEGSIVGE